MRIAERSETVLHPKKKRQISDYIRVENPRGKSHLSQPTNSYQFIWKIG